MSNFLAQAKKPKHYKTIRQWETVIMLDNYFGNEYGIKFPDDKIYKESKCEIKKEKQCMDCGKYFSEHQLSFNDGKGFMCKSCYKHVINNYN